MTVVHCKHHTYNVYIGRPSKWGNPFEIGKDGTREEVIQKYADWIKTQPDLIADLPELRGQILGCWCTPEACHGEVLDYMANDPTLLPAGTQIPVGFGYATILPDFDFETYSEAGYVLDPVTGKVRGIGPQGKGGLPVVGTPVYAEHPSTEILCLYYDLKDGQGRRAWYPGTPEPTDLLQHIAAGSPIEAHNITFEFWIWNIICVRRYGWPALILEQCHCSMAKARRFALPGALGNLAGVLGTAQKDKHGTTLIQQLSRPNNTTKNRQYFRRTPVTDWDLFCELYAYCDQDIVAEAGVSARMPDLTPYERRTWEVDQTINVRGVQVDIDALDACIDVMRQAETRYTNELGVITGGAVNSVSEVAKIVGWLNDQGLHIPNMQADTVKEYLAREDVNPPCRRVLEIRAILGGANVKKLYTLKRSVSSDGRLRDQYMYCGADRTGRWSAGGVQLQNLTSKGPKSKTCNVCGRIVGKIAICCPDCGAGDHHFTERKDWTVEAVEWAIKDILTRDLDHIITIWGDPADVLAGCLRGLLVAKLGHDLVCADFSAIEAVVAACVSRCQWRIDIFSSHAKIYEASAAKATGIPFEEILQYKKDNGQHHPARKTIGKVRELAGGYGGWINAWKNFGADKFMTDDEIKADVLKWREESPEIVEMWGGQFKWCGPGKWDYRPELFGLEGAVIQAILTPGQWFGHIDIGYIVRDDVLFCRLPSGRYLHYHRPKLVPAQDKLNRGPAWSITFEGFNTDTTKGPRGWLVMETYGGRLFENAVQAIAADIQAEGLVRLEDNGYPVVMHTHDEGVSELPEDQGSVEEMEAIMAQRPEWATWWPIRAAGWRHRRYQKD